MDPQTSTTILKHGSCGRASSLCKRLSPSYTGNRPSNLIANWFLIFARLKTGAVHFFVIPAVTRYSSLRAASALGNAPFVFTTFRT